MKVQRYFQLPRTLYRVCAKLPITLRDYDSQLKLKRTSYDLKLVNGLYLPAEGDEFVGPNGLSLRPSTTKMHEVLREFRGQPRIFCLHEGFVLPEGFVVLHEHSDHYSLQTTKPIALPEYVEAVNKFIQSFPSQTREEFFEELNDEDDQNN